MAYEMNRLNEADVARIQNQFKIPVDCEYPLTYWIIALDRESFMPTDIELSQLRNYCEFVVHNTYNNPHYILVEKPLAWCSGHNTIVFRNGLRATNFRKQHDPGEWFYRRMTWTVGPTYVPDIFGANDLKYEPHSLIDIFNRIEKNVPEKWEEWKNKNNKIYAP